MWKNSLRKREGARGRRDAAAEKVAEAWLPPKGLSEFLFHHNSLSRKFMEALTEELPTDIYVRKIDLRYNKITESQILGPFIESMYINESILNIDFSFNSGHTDTVK